MFEVLKSLGSAILIIGLCFFIFTNAIGSSNFKRKSIYYLIFGLVLFGLLGIGLLEELQTKSLKELSVTSWGMALVTLLYTLIFVVFNLVMAKRYHHNFKSYRSTKPKDQMYLYILYQYEDAYLLAKQEGSPQGEVVLFDKDILFHDEMMERWIKRRQLQVVHSQKIGTAYMEEKRPKKYFCYHVEVSSMQGLEDYIQVNKFDLALLDTSPFHKKLLLRIGLKDNFEIRN